MEFLLLLVVLIPLLGAAFYGLRVVREYERLVVFRLGRCIGEKGPGLVIVWPIIDTAVSVDLRERVEQIPHQTCITKDNAPISIDFLVYLRIVDPTESVLRVSNLPVATQGIATTTLRAVIGDLNLDDALARRDQINHVLQAKLDEVTVRWGVKVTAVEIREIEPPREVQEAMNRQMSAERNRRATVLEAEGKRQASVTVAEGEKEAAILKAEGERQATILRAEAGRQAAILQAEGFALALGKVYDVAHTVDERTMQLQYFDTLKALGEGPATKFIFPMEFTSLLGRMASRVEDGASPSVGGNRT
ncbi:MAG: SPFH/Band 7/PHB domain protein [Chloroflexi bacterium]|nr:SPFH/Band 7/PHB domain protein [Chloroflexota bacterium]